MNFRLLSLAISQFLKNIFNIQMQLCSLVLNTEWNWRLKTRSVRFLCGSKPNRALFSDSTLVFTSLHKYTVKSWFQRLTFLFLPDSTKNLFKNLPICFWLWKTIKFLFYFQNWNSKKFNWKSHKTQSVCKPPFFLQISYFLSQRKCRKIP